VNRLVLRGGLRSFVSGGHTICDRLSTLLKEYPSQYDLEASKAQGKDVMQALECEIEEEELHRLIQSKVSLLPAAPNASADSTRYPLGQKTPIVIDLKREATEQAAQALFEVDEDGGTLSHAILDSILHVCYIPMFYFTSYDVVGGAVTDVWSVRRVILTFGLFSSLVFYSSAERR
jgi:hypothetical protein